jgi:hypothetical protein
MTMFLKESEIKGIVTYTGFHIQLTVNEDAKIVDIKDEDGSILEVKKNGSRLFFKGDHIYVKDRGWYQLNDIALMHSQKGMRTYRGLTMERSDTSLLILPVYGGARADVSFSTHLMNAYLYREGRMDGCVWVLMKRPHVVESEYENAMIFFRSSDHFMREEELGSEYVMVTLAIPDDFIEDLIRIRVGKFSEISESHKKRIYDFHMIRDKYNKIRLELEKSSLLRDKMEKEYDIEIPEGSELRSSIDEERETFYDKYIIQER